MSQPSTLKERILQYAQVHLGAEPEHLWAKFPAMPSCATAAAPSGLRPFWRFPEPGWGWNGRSLSTFSM